MKNSLVRIPIRCFLILLTYHSCVSMLTAQESKVVYPLQDDVNSLEGIMKAYYEVVSGPAGEPRQIERDRSLHHPDAFIAITGEDDQGEAYTRTMNLDEFHANTGPYETGFWEYEIERKVSTYGHITHVWSSYAWSTTKDGPIGGRGINSIQLVNDGSRWWIMSWMYDSERPNNPLPGQIAEEIPDWFFQDLKNHIGIWKTDNSKYADIDGGIDEFVIEWTWGIDRKSILGRLFGMKDETSVGDLWQFRYHWDPEMNEAMIVQYGFNGMVGRGVVQNLGEGKSESIQTFFTPGANASYIKHQETLLGDIQTSISYKKEKDRWVKNRNYTWHRKSETDE